MTSGLSGAMSSGNLSSYIEAAENFRRESTGNINYLEQNTVPHPHNPLNRNLFNFGKKLVILAEKPDK